MSSDAPNAPPTPARRMVVGGLRVFLAECLLIPSGLLTAAYLARRLGPDGYGIFTLAAALVAWVEWGLTAVFSRASVKLVAEADDWRPMASTIVSVHLGLATVAAALLAALAGPIASWLGTPSLASPLRLFALDIPLFCLAQAHRGILVGIGDFGERALAAAARWVSRLLLVVLFVELGLSLSGAVLGSIGASLVEVAVCRYFVRPAFSLSAMRRIGRVWGVVAPLLVSAVALRLFDRLDLVSLTALGGSPEQLGHYGAAQNLAILPGLFGLSFSPVLLATLTRAYRDGDETTARRFGSGAMRGVLLLLPFVAICAGASDEIVALVFGPAFAPAGALVPPLLGAALALVMVGVTSATLIAAGRPGLSAAFTAPLPVVAGLAYLAVIPALGPAGAARVTVGIAVLAAAALVAAVARVCGILPPLGTAVRSLVLAAGAYLAALLWPASGVAVVLELAILAVAVLAMLLATGELTPEEVAAARAWWRRGPRRSS